MSTSTAPLDTTIHATVTRDAMSFMRRAFRRREEFMTAARGYSAHECAITMYHFTHGIDWRGCTKGHIAESFAMGDDLQSGRATQKRTAAEFRAKLIEDHGEREGR